jgi:hypothetical protein
MRAVDDFRAKWKRLSDEYIAARERLESVAAVIAAQREGFVTPTAEQLMEQADAQLGFRTATTELYTFLSAKENSAD